MSDVLGRHNLESLRKQLRAVADALLDKASRVEAALNSLEGIEGMRDVAPLEIVPSDRVKPRYAGLGVMRRLS